MPLGLCYIPVAPTSAEAPLARMAAPALTMFVYAPQVIPAIVAKQAGQTVLLAPIIAAGQAVFLP